MHELNLSYKTGNYMWKYLDLTYFFSLYGSAIDTTCPGQLSLGTHLGRGWEFLLRTRKASLGIKHVGNF